MPKTLKKAITLVLTMVLVTGQLIVPIFAAEADGATEPQPEVVVDVTVTPVENGAQTTTVTTDTATGSTETTTETVTTVTDEDGNHVTTTTTQTSAADPQAGTNSQTTTTEVVTTTADGSMTTTDTDWTTTSTESANITQTGAGKVETDQDKFTTVTGSEDSTEEVSYDSAGNKITEGSAQGTETTQVTDTTVTTTTQTDEFLYKDTIVDPTHTEELPATDVTTGNWVEGTPTDNAWQQGSLTAGVGDDLGDAQTTTGKSTDATPDAPGTTLTMTPGGTDIDKYIITLDDVSSGKYPQPNSTQDYTVTEIKENGKVIGWEVTHKTTATTTQSPVAPINTTPDAQWVQVGAERHVVVRPDGYEVDAEGTTVGNVTTKVEEILDENGNFLGYRITTITVDKTNNENAPVSTESQRETIETLGTTEPNGFTLPEKPAESNVTDASGTNTTITVTDILKDGVVVGYTVVTTVTDTNGLVLHTETKNLYGTASTTKTDVVADPTTDVTTTYTTVTTTEVEEIYVTRSERTMQRTQQQIQLYDTALVTEADLYQLVNGADGNLYFLYEGKMYAVTGTNTIKNSYDVATGETVAMSGYTDEDDIRVKGDTIRKENGGTTTVSDYYTNQTFHDDYHDDGSPDDNYRHIGYGLFSDFVLTDSQGKAHTAKQFKIQDGDEIRYVYCVELGAGIAAGTYYSANDYAPDDNNNVTPWAGASGTVQQLRSVALNGFWGTESGLGSLESVKELMRRNGLTAEADRLTVGMAVAATQAAIWEFSSPDKNLHFNNDFLTYDDELGAAPTAADKAAITGLRDLLVKLAKDTGKNGEGVAQAITAATITGGTITVKDQVTDDSGKVQTDAQGNDLYNADITFTMEVSTSSLHGDLVLEVIDANGRVIGKYRLAGEEGGLYLGFTTRIRPDANGTYTLSDLQLAEDVVINLNLKGVQHLDDGIYIYKGKHPTVNRQDFIGLSQKENHVNLNIQMEFSVEEPQVQHTRSTTTQARTDSQLLVKTDTRKDTKTAVRTVNTGTVQTDKTHKVDVYGTVTTTVTEIDTNSEVREWETNWIDIEPPPYYPDYGDEEAEQPEQDDDPYDPNAAPKTGDNSLLWSVLSLISVLGLIAMNWERVLRIWHSV